MNILSSGRSGSADWDPSAIRYSELPPGYYPADYGNGKDVSPWLSSSAYPQGHEESSFTTVERRDLIGQLRASGLSYEGIAKELGISGQRVHQLASEERRKH